MRNAQGLPVNMIVLTALALLVLVVVGAFFISGFGQATGSINIIDATQADCQNLCQSLATSAFNYDDCGDSTDGFKATQKALNYACACNQFGACTVTLRGGGSCVISQTEYTDVSSWASDALPCSQFQ
jgi:hypothetical protein